MGGPFVWGEHSTIPGKREAVERLAARSAVLRAFELESPPWQREAKREPCEWGDECSDSDCELEHPRWWWRWQCRYRHETWSQHRQAKAAASSDAAAKQLQVRGAQRR